MTRNEAIAELVRIWHSPHLDLSLKAGLAEAIETLKEKNQSDSLVRGEVDACKESESKLDLIRREDAIEVLMETIAPPSAILDTLVMRINSLPSAEARPTGEWIPVSERLPERGKDVLVTRKYYGKDDGNKDAIYVEISACYADGEEWHGYSDEYKMNLRNHKVVAWMPLPEPYKGGDSK